MVTNVGKKNPLPTELLFNPRSSFISFLQFQQIRCEKSESNSNIKAFHHLPIPSKQPQIRTNSAFHTFEKNMTNPNESKSTRCPRGPKRCLCDRPSHDYDPSHCICGLSNHRYNQCRALNPSFRNTMWVMTQSMVDRINHRLDMNPELRIEVLGFGYEYYKPIYQRPPPPPPEKNPLAQLSKLPGELLTRILDWTFVISIVQSPKSLFSIDSTVAEKSTIRGAYL